MKHYKSVSRFPGKTGQYYYTKFFEHYNIAATYTPVGLEHGIADFIEKEKQQGTAGISVSMPFKSAVMDCLDELDISAVEYGTVNTVTVNNGHTCGYNADLAGVEYTTGMLDTNDRIMVLGSGSMASMYVFYLRTHGYNNVQQIARSPEYNNWDSRFDSADVVINCTALGTSTTESPYQLGQLSPDVRLVIDLAIKPNDFAKQCLTKQVKYVNGTMFYRQQFLRQFEIYTGIKPSAELFDIFERQLNEKI